MDALELQNQAVNLLKLNFTRESSEKNKIFEDKYKALLNETEKIQR